MGASAAGSTLGFEQVFNDELDGIRASRDRQDATLGALGAEVPRAADPLPRAHAMHLHGLAFSGGGIRSATFNLGVLQALATLRLLGRFDYLSTVSGGGYIGSWLSALVERRTGDRRTAAALETQLAAEVDTPTGRTVRGEEDKAIGFLRAYSHYLTPKSGLLSTDTLAGVSAYLRNLILVQTTILSLLVFLLLLPRALYLALQWLDASALLPLSRLVWAATAAWALCAACMGLNMRRMRADDPPWLRRASSPGFAWFAVILPGTLGAFLWSHALLLDLRQPGAPDLLHLTGTLSSSTFWPLWLGALGAVTNVVAGLVRVQRGDLRAWGPAAMAVCGAIGGLVCGAGFNLLQLALVRYGDYAGEAALRWLSLAVGPFAVLQVVSLGIVFYLGALGRIVHQDTHEWWARYGALLLAVTVGLGGLFAIGVYGPALVEYAHAWVMYAGGAAWVAGTLWGLLKGASADTAGTRASLTERLVSAVPYLSMVCLCVFLAWACQAVIDAVVEPAATPCRAASCPAPDRLPLAEPPLPVCAVGDAEPQRPCIVPTLTSTAARMDGDQGQALLWMMLAASGTLCVLLCLRVDINLFSFHNFYRNRLTRCYLGGARMGQDADQPPRNASYFTGFDPSDDIPLRALAGGDGHAGDIRPYHLVNTAINMSAGRELAWQQRKASSFFFSPRYCGFQLPATAEFDRPLRGFAPTSTYMRAKDSDAGFMLGSALAVSGAAASPNAGFHTSPGVAFVLTLFNIRLGRWCPNPASQDMRPRPSPGFGGWWLLRELFGATTATSQYVYLSDGGHFDNLGLYELVRRRVGTVVVCDCGQDLGGQFDDLADTMRKCYTDFGVRIDLDVGDLAPAEDGAERGFSRASFKVGAIKYPAQGGNPAFDGKLLLIKPTRTRALWSRAPDIRNYASTNPSFPQQTTADQWFDEAQFESYRKLGYLIGMEAFGASYAGWVTTGSSA